MKPKKSIDIHVYLKNKTLVKDEAVILLASKFLEKAQHNILLANALTLLNENSDVKKQLHLSSEYTADDWIIIVSYYSMYSAATALLAKVGYKSDAHSATLTALNHFFVKKELLEPRHLTMFIKAQLSVEEIKGIGDAKENREKAQYQVTTEITHLLAETTLKNAREFVAKAELLIQE